MLFRSIVTYDRIDPARFATAIERLPAISREVFLLHSREDLDFGRIAARLRIAIERHQAPLLVQTGKNPAAMPALKKMPGWWCGWAWWR